MNRILLLTLVVLLSTISLCFHTAEIASGTDDTSQEAAFKAIYDSIIFGAAQEDDSKGQQSQFDYAAIIVAMAYVDLDAARRVLLRLAPIYLGESAGEAMTSAITQQGEKILPAIVEATRTGIRCELPSNFKDRTYPKCRKPEETRAQLQIWIRQIRDKQVVEYVW